MVFNQHIKYYNKWNIVKQDLICQENLKINQIWVSLSNKKGCVNKAVSQKLCTSSRINLSQIYSN